MQIFSQKGRKVLNTKILTLRKQNDLSQQDFAERTGISTRTLQSYEYGEQSPKYEYLQRLSSIFNVPMSYFENVVNQKESVVNVSSMSKKVSSIKKENVVNPQNPLSIAIPVYDEVFASAGVGRLNDECVSFYLHFEKAFLKSYFKLTNTEHLALLRLEGDSMMPTLPPNARLLVQASTQFKEGQIVLCRLDDELFVKRLQKQPELKLLSDNKAYEPIALSHKDYELLSVVVGFIKALNWFKRYLNTFKGACKFF